MTMTHGARGVGCGRPTAGGVDAPWRAGGWLLLCVMFLGTGRGALSGPVLPDLDQRVERVPAAPPADVDLGSLDLVRRARGLGAQAAGAVPAGAAWIARPRHWGEGLRLLQGQRIPVLDADASASAEGRALLAAELVAPVSGRPAGVARSGKALARGHWRIAEQRRDAVTGGRHVWVEEVEDGRRVFGARTGVHMDAAGSVWRIERAGLRAFGWVPTPRQPELTPRDALEAVELWSGVTPLYPVVRGRAGKDGETDAELMWFPLDPWDVRLSWVLTAATARRGGSTHRCVVDAVTGEVLRVARLTRDAAPSWLVFPGESPRPGGLPAAPAEPDLDPLGNTRRTIVATNGWALASPEGWVTGATTQGNNVWAQADRLGTDDQTYRPEAAALAFEYPLDLLAWSADAYKDASVANLFYWANIAHDWLYRRGFDEAAGCFQVRNFGRGGRENDPVLADTLDGAGTNNAQFTPSPDGSPGRLEMFVWTGGGLSRDSSYDTMVVLHEYVHGLSTRLAGGPDDVDVLVGKQSGGLGEGWSDWFALSMTAAPGGDFHAPRAFAAYVGSNYQRGIRRYPYSADMSVNPLTYGDLRVHQQVHQVGEVWCAALWDAWVAAVDCYGLDEGRRRMEEIVVAGLAMTGSAPTFLDARDAILLADEMTWGGSHQFLLWQAFARRGIGLSARDGGSDLSLLVTEAFDLPELWAGLGEARFGQAAYRPGVDAVPVEIEVRDGDLAGGTSLDVALEVVATGDAEVLTLAEVGCGSGVFTGALLLVALEQGASANLYNGLLESIPAGNLVLTYEDERHGDGGPAAVEARASLDSAPPEFGGLRSLTPGVRSLVAVWDPAVDASPPIRYSVYAWPSGGSMPEQPAVVVTNETSAVVGGLPVEPYAALVRAEDLLGNREQNEVIHVATPLPHGPPVAVVVSGAPDRGVPGAVMSIEFALVDGQGYPAVSGDPASFRARLHGPAVWLDLDHPQLLAPLGPQDWMVQTDGGRLLLHATATGTGWVEATSQEATPSGLAVTSEAPTQFIRVPAVWADLDLLGGIDAGITDDDQVRQGVPLGFSFPYYGNEYSTVAVSANGYASVGTTYHYGNHYSIPEPAAPNGYMAPFATDLYPMAGRSAVRYRTFGQAPDRRFVLQWSQMAHYDDREASYSFQLLLGEDGSIEFQYGAMSDGALAYANGGDSTVGVESPAGTAGVEFSYDQPGAVVPWSGLRLVRARSASLFIGGLAGPWADGDGDGLSDAAEAILGTDDTATDSDGDSMQDGTELVVTGTDPRDPASCLNVRVARLPAEAAVAIEWPGRTGRSYRIEAASSESPQIWALLPGASEIPGEPPVTRWIAPVAGQRGLVYRVGVNW